MMKIMVKIMVKEMMEVMMIVASYLVVILIITKPNIPKGQGLCGRGAKAIMTQLKTF